MGSSSNETDTLDKEEKAYRAAGEDADLVCSTKNPIETIVTVQQENNTPDRPKSKEVYRRGCPFEARRGYVDARSDYLFYFHNVVDDDSSGTEDDLPPKSLVASTNLDDPLYFWQIYSLIGHKPLVALVTDFYKRVFDDTENDWFRGVFVAIAPLNHHIMTQAAYWVDAFGGGKRYHGGNYRVNFHHTYNAREVMNARGAKRWMHHMTNTLISAKDTGVFKKDPRILPCIVDFLDAKMRTYAHETWDFDASDFNQLREVFGHRKEDGNEPQ
jgi:truncated hemoglobin YjbI